MFLGTTPAYLRPFLANELARLKPQRVHVPFAGNFVIEQLAAASRADVEVFSTDVSLYSRAIGFGVTDQEFDAVLKPALLDLFPTFEKRTSPMEKAAIMIFLADVAENLAKNNVRYYQQLNAHTVRNADRYFDQIMRRLEQFRQHLPKALHFLGYDACKALELVQPGDFVYYDPPFWEGGYEKMFEALEACWSFTPEPYTVITETMKAQQLQSLARIAHTYWRTLNPIKVAPPGYTEVFRYEYRLNTSCCVYSNAPDRPFIGSVDLLTDKARVFPVIGEDDVITHRSKVQILQVESAIGNHYRLMWMQGIPMMDNGWSFLIFVDGKLIGTVQIAASVQYGSPWALINSDPAAPSSRYRRLSRLILYLVSTEDMLKKINELSMWEHTGFTTKVFSRNPVSMRYRGFFELTDRKKAKGSAHKYELIYHSRRLFKTYKEALTFWCQRDASDLSKGEHEAVE